MIPPTISRPFGRALAARSPRLSEIDLAQVIDRTIRMAVEAHRDQGFAAVWTGCDGRQRTTMFDGSACQTEADRVCIAQRQDGISACIEVPMQGAGLTFQSIVFRPVPCSPVTGDWLLDADGYLYRLPEALVTTVPYWPPTVPTPVTLDMVRAGTWANLMCAAALGDPSNQSTGASEWLLYAINGEETGYTQLFSCAIGGMETYLDAIPTLTATSNNVAVGPISAHWAGVAHEKLTSTNVGLNQSSSSGVLTSGTEYKATIYATLVGGVVTVYTLKGPKAAIGTSVAPSAGVLVDYLPLAVATVTYSATGTRIPTVVSIATLLRLVGGLYESPREALLVRDGDAPNPGVRYVDMDLGSADSGVVSGHVRVAFGYALATMAFTEHLDEGAPWPIQYGSTVGRSPYDMAFVFGPPRLGVEYSSGHVNLAGPDIDAPDDGVLLSGLAAGPYAHDIGANVLALPNGEIGLDRPYTGAGTPIFPQCLERYRIRPAPDSPPTLTVEQLELGPSWGDDPNAWVAAEDVPISVWTTGATTFHRTSGAWTHGRSVPCVLWHRSFGTPSLDPTAKYGTLETFSGADVTVAFDGGGGAQPCLGAPSLPTLTILGTDLVAGYGWTFTRDGVESALSPLVYPVRIASLGATTTHSLSLAVPLGPAGTSRRTLYRFAWDRKLYPVFAGAALVSPWHSEMFTLGAVYDRMFRLVASVDDNTTEAILDESTSITFSGQRPPVPFISAGGVVLDTPSRVVMLPPLEL